MSDLKHLEFVERDRVWEVTEVYDDGQVRPGEPFQASGHENHPKLEQLQMRMRIKYGGYRVTHYARSHAGRYTITVERTPAT